MCLLLFLCFLCGCSNTVFDCDDETIHIKDLSVTQNNEDKNNSDFFIGAWLSYLEIKPESFSVTEEEYEKYISSVFENLKKIKVNNVFVQVRPFADSIYPSEFFPSSSCVVKKQGDELPFDFFKVIIECAGKHSIDVHAWINPYRVQKDFNANELSENNIAKKWLNEKGEELIKCSGGLYFNPSGLNAQKLILSGVREILKNYNVKGIHIDDYFYPSSEKDFDKASFENYKKSGGTLELADWRRENVNSLVSSIYSAVKSFGSDKLFSISPSGDIDKNRNVLFADVEKWCKEDGFCDLIIPQIYYGFENEAQPFEKCAARWKNLCTSNTEIAVGLALYKAGKEDAFAGKLGKYEWINNSDILKRQVLYLKEDGFDGICFYSARFVNFIEISTQKELKNLLDVV